MNLINSGGLIIIFQLLKPLCCPADWCKNSMTVIWRIEGCFFAMCRLAFESTTANVPIFWSKISRNYSILKRLLNQDSKSSF